MVKIPVSKQYGQVMGLIDGLDGFKYVIPSWTRVPYDTQYQDLEPDPNQVIDSEKSIDTVEEQLPDWQEKIISSTQPNKFYIVSRYNTEFTCTCPKFTFNPKKECKHIKKLKRKYFE